MIYLLNSAVLTAYGEWRYTGPITVEQARRRITADCVSAIGHASSAAFLSVLLGQTIATNRISVEMLVGDAALVMRLKQRYNGAYTCMSPPRDFVLQPISRSGPRHERHAYRLDTFYPVNFWRHRSAL